MSAIIKLIYFMVDHTLVLELKDIQVKVNHTFDFEDILGLQVEVSRTLELGDTLN